MHLFNIQVSIPVASPAQKMWIGPKKLHLLGISTIIIIIIINTFVKR